MQPIIVALASPYVTKTKLTRRQLICALVAIFGMVLVSDVLNTGIKAPSEIKGILLGLGAAVLYAIVIFMNQDFSDIEQNHSSVTFRFRVYFPLRTDQGSPVQYHLYIQ